jgi:hypothetical protein
MGGLSCQSPMHVSRLSVSAWMFAADRIYRAQMLMLLVSMSAHSFCNSSIMSGYRDVRWLSTATTTWLSSGMRTVRPRGGAEKKGTASRMAVNSFKVMCFVVFMLRPETSCFELLVYSNYPIPDLRYCSACRRFRSERRWSGRLLAEGTCLHN